MARKKKKSLIESPIFKKVLLGFGILLIISGTINGLFAIYGIYNLYGAISTQRSRAVDFEFRELAINWSIGCRSDRECYAYNIYKEMSKFEFVPTGPSVTPREVLRTKAGDCDTLALTYCTLVNQIDNIGCYIRCIPPGKLEAHCWNQIDLKSENKTVIVDLANGLYAYQPLYSDEYKEILEEAENEIWR